jgi:hypothetical protein
MSTFGAFYAPLLHWRKLIHSRDLFLGPRNLNMILWLKEETLGIMLNPFEIFTSLVSTFSAGQLNQVWLAL